MEIYQFYFLAKNPFRQEMREQKGLELTGKKYVHVCDVSWQI